MKTTLIILCLFICSFANATNRYFSSSTGNDLTGNGTIGNPYASITKLNSVFTGFAAGDSILFKRGDVFVGTITPNKSGTSIAPFVFAGYGTGADPVITSFVSITSWVAKGNGIYESASALTGVSFVNMVTVNGANTGMGRTPNVGSYDSILTSTSTSLTVYGLQAVAVPGAQIVPHTRWWIWDPTTIQTRVGNTVTVLPPSPTSFTYAPTPKWGCFIQNALGTLDQNGEWYFNPSTGKFSIYSNSGTPTGVQVATLNNVVLINSRTWLKFVGLNLQGANSHTVAINGSQNIFILNNTIKFNGDCGINYNTTSNHITISGNTIKHTHNNGIETNDGDLTITNNIIDSTSLIIGMGKNGEAKGNGIAIRIFDNNGLVSGNQVLHSGYCGIAFKNNAGAATSNNILIENNFINYACLTKGDGAGIYTWAKGAHSTYTNRIIRNNIIKNVIGNNAGTINKYNSAYGFYGDEGASDLLITGNIFDSCGRAGLYLNEGCQNIDIFYNKFYYNGWNMLLDPRGCQLFFNEQDSIPLRIRNIRIRGNEIWALNNIDLIRTYNSGAANFAAAIDSNYYVHSSTNTIPFNSRTSLGTVDNTFQQWKARGFDAHGDTTKVTSTVVVRDIYAVSADTSFFLLGYNWTNARKGIFSGSYLTVRAHESAIIRRTTLNGLNPPTVNIFSPAAFATFTGPANITISATAMSTGSTITDVKFYNGATLLNTDNTSPYSYNWTGVGAGTYTITAKATDNNGLSTTSSPVTVTVDPVVIPPTNKLPVVTITSPPNDSSYFAPATIVINVSASDSDGTISTVHFYKNGVYAGLDNSSPYQFTFSSQPAAGYSFTATAIDDDGDSTSTSINIPVVTPVYIPPDTLSIGVTITSPILCNGGNATVTVTSTGGVDPITGEGDFTKSAGVYDFIVTDANGLKDTLTMSVPQPGPLSATVSSDTIVSYLGSVNKTINPLGGTSPYQFSINNGVTWQTSAIFKLYAGSYTVTVKDANGCTTTVSFSLTQPPPAGNYIIHKKGRKFLNL